MADGKTSGVARNTEKVVHSKAMDKPKKSADGDEAKRQTSVDGGNELLSTNSCQPTQSCNITTPTPSSPTSSSSSQVELKSSTPLSASKEDDEDVGGSSGGVSSQKKSRYLHSKI
tara:strand:- start:430 stop:774 length:345 start_codon:yes stop_codon:yes gene_type:complete